MKTLGSILIILAVFSVVVVLMVTAVNTAGNLIGSDGPRFDGAPQLRPPGDGGGEIFRPEGNGNRPDGGDNRSDGGGGRGINYGRIASGLVKNTVVIGFLVIVIVLPKSFFKKKKRTPKPNSANGESS